MNDWKKAARQALGELGRPYVLIVYDTPILAGDEWKLERGVPFWVHSRVEPSMRVLDHIREVLENETAHRKGRVAADLWQAGAQWWLLELPQSMAVWRGAAASLGLEGEEWKDHLGDIASEAIEHAEALGL